MDLHWLITAIYQTVIAQSTNTWEIVFGLDKASMFAQISVAAGFIESLMDRLEITYLDTLGTAPLLSEIQRGHRRHS